MVRFDAISVIPQVFDAYLSASVLGKAKARGIFQFYSHDLRAWTHDAHKTVDDALYGGGVGMLLKPQPIYEAVEAVCSSLTVNPHIIFFAPWGKIFAERDAVRLSTYPNILYVCGRYEGVDERTYNLAHEVFSLGDFVLSGAELPALCMTDAIVRKIPGALGNDMSVQDESFHDSLLEGAHYTRPEVFRDQRVPEVLLSGNHGDIELYRRQMALARTWRHRPDLLRDAQLEPQDYAYLEWLVEKCAPELRMQATPYLRGATTPSSITLPAHKSVQKEEVQLKQKHKREGVKRFFSALLDVVIILLAAFAISAAVRVFVAEPFEIPSESMLQTLQVGDKLLGEKITLFWDDPSAGEIVTFTNPEDPDVTLIKRVIATPGQTVDLQNGQVYVDGVAQNEPYTNGEPSYPLSRHASYLSQNIQYPYTLQEDEYWMMGDNRTNSLDSRYFGPIKRSTITSKAWAIFWPFDRATFL